MEGGGRLQKLCKQHGRCNQELQSAYRVGGGDLLFDHFLLTCFMNCLLKLSYLKTLKLILTGFVY